MRCGVHAFLGTRLVHSVRAISLEQGAVVNFESSVLRFGGSRLDLSGCGGILPGMGCIEFNGASPQVFLPAAGKICPSVFRTERAEPRFPDATFSPAASLSAPEHSTERVLGGHRYPQGESGGHWRHAQDRLGTPVGNKCRGGIFLDQMAILGDVDSPFGVKQDLRYLPTTTLSN